MSAITASVRNKFWLFVFDILLLLLFFVDVSFVVDYAIVPNFFLLVYPREEHENCDEKPCQQTLQALQTNFDFLSFTYLLLLFCCFVIAAAFLLFSKQKHTSLVLYDWNDYFI